ncbi:MAG: SCO family protein [Candidatus Hinthialibacter antarcticus]|nr:SCO family protein [Candidatus Hinthialibacter antarcticus]
MKSMKRLLSIQLCVFMLALLTLFVTPVGAVVSETGVGENSDPLPAELEGVGITEKLEAPLPLQLEFKDENDNTVQLEQYFKNDKPVILTLVYYRCPMLCGLVLNGLLESMQEISLNVGEDFEIVTVSIDPLETPKLAKIKKQSYIKEFGKPEAAPGWHFLSGKEKNIRTLADSVGFGYKWIERRKEFAHGAAIMIITPDGRVSRYLGGIEYEPKTLRLSLVEASEGKIGTMVDQFFLSCFHYDPDAGAYSVAAMGVMRLGGGLVACSLGVMLIVFWSREMKNRKAQTAKPIEGNS